MTRASRLPGAWWSSVSHSASARRRYEVRQPSGGGDLPMGRPVAGAGQHLQVARLGFADLLVQIAAA